MVKKSIVPASDHEEPSPPPKKYILPFNAAADAYARA